MCRATCNLFTAIRISNARLELKGLPDHNIHPFLTHRHPPENASQPAPTSIFINHNIVCRPIVSHRPLRASKSTMAGGKGKSSGGKSSGGKTSVDGPKKQQSHSARAGLQVSKRRHGDARWCFQRFFGSLHSSSPHFRATDSKSHLGKTTPDPRRRVDAGPKHSRISDQSNTCPHRHSAPRLPGGPTRNGPRRRPSRCSLSRCLTSRLSAP